MLHYYRPILNCAIHHVFYICVYVEGYGLSATNCKRFVFCNALTGTKPYILRLRGVVVNNVLWYEWRWMGRHLKGQNVVNLMGTAPFGSSLHYCAFCSFHCNLLSQFQVFKLWLWPTNIFLFSSSIHWTYSSIFLWRNSPNRLRPLIFQFLDLTKLDTRNIYI